MLTTLEYTDGTLVVLDQTQLPNALVYEELNTVEQVFAAIQTLKVRGAPLIGVAAAYGVLVGVRDFKDSPDLVVKVHRVCEYLNEARPTAVNLSWALGRMLKTAQDAHAAGSKPSSMFDLLVKEARAIHAEDIAINKQIGEHAYELVKDKIHDNSLTLMLHCNAGVLATTGYGTATSVIYLLKEKGVSVKAFVCETRPLLQGARLTAYELAQAGIDATLITDNMAATVLSSGAVDCIFVGADRVAANLDVANKVGTLGLSILAKHYAIPFYVACPSPSYDTHTKTGADIMIEERDGSEITTLGGIPIAPENIKTFNPAFDITPYENITAIITESGVLENKAESETSAR